MIKDWQDQCVMELKVICKVISGYTASMEQIVLVNCNVAVFTVATQQVLHGCVLFSKTHLVEVIFFSRCHFTTHT